MLIPGMFSLTTEEGTDLVASSFKLMMIPVALYWNHRALVNFGVLSKGTPNPFEPLLWPSYGLGNGKYDKGLKDWLFVFNHVIFWSL
jgi:acyl-CoA-dependent ceramide synthase